MNVRGSVCVLLFCSVGIPVLAQSQEQNYIQKSTYLDYYYYGKTTDTIQYFDGLGRPVQVVSGDCNTDGTYQYLHQEYDGLGNVVKIWSPLIGDREPNMVSEKDLPFISRNNYNDEKAFSSISYDGLGRVMTITPPGEAWRGKCKKKYYRVNNESEIRFYSASDLSGKSYYKAYSLLCTMEEDEDQHKTALFEDFMGRKILERRFEGTEEFDTYYVYNNLNQLTCVLQPMYQVDADIDKYAFQYTYDAQGRMITKKMPGCEPVRYWYDAADRVIKMQDSNLREYDYFRTFEYDEIGRMIKQSIVWNGDGDFHDEDEGGNANGDIWEYDEIINYYDTYDYLDTLEHLIPYNLCSINDAFYDIGQPKNLLSEYAGIIENGGDYSIGLLTGTWQLSSNGEGVLSSYSYDRFGRLELQSDFGLDSHLSIKRKDYNYVGDLIKEEFEEYDYNPERQDIVLHLIYNGHILYYYGQNEKYNENPHTKLLSSSVITLNDVRNGVTMTDTIQKITYDEFGRVVKNDRSGKMGDMTYTYDNLRGWQTSITGANGVFRQKVYRESGAEMPCFNGNISALEWTTEAGSLNRYDYGYDKLNRLSYAKYSRYQTTVSSSGSITSTLIPGGNGRTYDFGVDYSYDKNSNLTWIERQGYKNGFFDTIDDLDIERNGNQLKSVYDGNQERLVYESAADFVDGADEDTEYFYDANGNLIQDNNKGLIYEYDLLGHPLAVSGSNTRVEYVYAADGRKLRTTHKQYTSTTKEKLLTSTTTDYRGRFIIKDGITGMCQFPGGYYEFTKGVLKNLCFYIQDYQGNNCMAVRSKSGILQRNNYYPYGGAIGRLDVNPDRQIFKYSGKELERAYGIELYDFHARQYDPFIGSFNSIDPHCESYYGVSPYAYCAGDPINCIDPTGMDTLNITGSWDSNQHWIWSIDYHQGGERDIYNVTNPAGNMTTYTFDAYADVSQLFIEQSNDLWLSVVNVKGQDIYGWAVNPAGEPSIYVGSGTSPYAGTFLLESHNSANNWRCAGPTVWGFNQQTQKAEDRQLRIHYAGWNINSKKYIPLEDWTQGCSVVSSSYMKDNNGDIQFQPKQSFEFYKSIQENLGGTQFTYSPRADKTRYGYRFSSPINKWMQIKY